MVRFIENKDDVETVYADQELIDEEPGSH